MKTQEWKECYAYRNIGIRGSNAKYETGMKELNKFIACVCMCILGVWVSGSVDVYGWDVGVHSYD